jgi:hypothetical protein
MLRSPNPLLVRSLATNPTPSSTTLSSTLPGGRHQAHAHRARARMPKDVGQGFLHDAEQAERHVGIERVEAVSRI